MSKKTKQKKGSKGPQTAAMSPQAFAKLRASLGLSQEKLADMLGVKVLTVGLWERGRVPIAYGRVLAIRAVEAQLTGKKPVPVARPSHLKSSSGPKPKAAKPKASKPKASSVIKRGEPKRGEPGGEKAAPSMPSALSVPPRPKRVRKARPIASAAPVSDVVDMPPDDLPVIDRTESAEPEPEPEVRTTPDTVVE